MSETDERVEAIARWLYTAFGEDPVARPWQGGGTGWQSSWLSSARELHAVARGLPDDRDLERGHCSRHVETWVEGGVAEHGCLWCAIQSLQDAAFRVRS